VRNSPRYRRRQRVDTMFKREDGWSLPRCHLCYAPAGTTPDMLYVVALLRVGAPPFPPCSSSLPPNMRRSLTRCFGTCTALRAIYATAATQLGERAAPRCFRQCYRLRQAARRGAPQRVLLVLLQVVS